MQSPLAVWLAFCAVGFAALGSPLGFGLLAVASLAFEIAARSAT